jgi:hypothetical protein
VAGIIAKVTVISRNTKMHQLFPDYLDDSAPSRAYIQFGPMPEEAEDFAEELRA